MACLTPALKSIPEGDWFCPKCVSDGKVKVRADHAQGNAGKALESVAGDKMHELELGIHESTDGRMTKRGSRGGGRSRGGSRGAGSRLAAAPRSCEPVLTGKCDEKEVEEKQVEDEQNAQADALDAREKQQLEEPDGIVEDACDTAIEPSALLEALRRDSAMGSSSSARRKGDKLRDAARLGIAVLQGLKVQLMTKPYNKAGKLSARCRLWSALGAVVQGDVVGGEQGSKTLRKDLLLVERNVSWRAVLSSYDRESVIGAAQEGESFEGCYQMMLSLVGSLKKSSWKPAYLRSLHLTGSRLDEAEACDASQHDDQGSDVDGIEQKGQDAEEEEEEEEEEEADGGMQAGGGATCIGAHVLASALRASLGLAACDQGSGVWKRSEVQDAVLLGIALVSGLCLSRLSKVSACCLSRFLEPLDYRLPLLLNARFLVTRIPCAAFCNFEQMRRHEIWRM
jgi:hypothetical protein